MIVTASSAIPEAMAGTDAGCGSARLVELVSHLRAARCEGLARVPSHRLLEIWSETIETFLDPQSEERRELDPRLLEASRLSPAGLDAALRTVAGGLRRDAARRLFQRARANQGAEVTLVILASNLPALALQPLLAALAQRRPLVVKSASSEPYFTPAFLAALTRKEPALDDAFAAVTWRGGDRAVEAPLLRAVDRVLAYGRTASLRELAARTGGKLIACGPKASFAVVARGADLSQAARGIALDTALFDQRGCLSVQAVFTDGDDRRLAAALAGELEELAERLPPGPHALEAAAGVQQLRCEARLRGLEQHALPMGAGTVVIEPEARFIPSPGLRTLRVHPLGTLGTVEAALSPWRRQLQGASLAGEAAWQLVPGLKRLGVSRFTPPGNLQATDADWFDGGLDPLQAV